MIAAVPPWKPHISRRRYGFSRGAAWESVTVMQQDLILWNLICNTLVSNGIWELGFTHKKACVRKRNFVQMQSKVTNRF